ncbi:MAG: Ku protein [Candidatus Parvarchaeota archaeon]|nr:Ku protein [Candidatus Jingweiarchaeum tengchongense]MCW1298043.1 Ku protein [Candidatus Jingweiarchaeum tengchongense]MCW1300157.1 Ku protein [Candidatus Jingweiarchaeum tengchongense]MCW1304367.1 Ku protein [Candidatus Jingweiarchaeum tengchongense]MCW1305913.1 Ku protein [Candidatus Jingweiarchaeum tengchongense]
MVHAIWKGSISFGLVNIPIKIYVATKPKEIEFNNLCSECNTPLEYKRWCPKCEKEIAWRDVKKGFKISKDKWIVIEKEDLNKIKLPSTKTIDIKQFVDISQIDPIFFEKSYYVVPDEGGVKSYSLLVEALRITNKAAVGKVVMRDKEYLVCLRPFQNGLIMHILFFLSEIKDIKKLKELENLVIVSKEELELAKMLINKLTQQEFNPAKFKDQYTEALKELIKAKSEGKEFKVSAEERVEKAEELISALKESIEKEGEEEK